MEDLSPGKQQRLVEFFKDKVGSRRAVCGAEVGGCLSWRLGSAGELGVAGVGSTLSNTSTVMG